MDTIDVMFSFDTTGSMYPCINEVRRNVEEIIAKLFNEIPNIRIGVIAHGDYCDGNDMIKSIDLTDDKLRLINFVRNVKPTNGGDYDECYERVLHDVRLASWKSENKKILVMIGDAIPHNVGYRYNNVTYNIDWRNEVSILKQMGVVIYSVQCLKRKNIEFWKSIAQKTDGVSLSLNQFSVIRDYIFAICYNQQSTERVMEFEHEIINKGGMNREINEMFNKILNRSNVKFNKSIEELGAVADGRFQVIYVDRDVPIKDFVEENGLPFKKGRGFYELTKTETIQDYKEIILMNKESGDLFNGDKARELAGIPIGITTRMKIEKNDKFIVFCQSTSYNRKLVGNTRFLYEICE